MAVPVRTGIHYPSIAPTARALGFRMTPARMLDLQLMERAALAAWAEKR